MESLPERKFGAKCIINDLWPSKQHRHIWGKKLLSVYLGLTILFHGYLKHLYSWLNSEQMQYHWSKNMALCQDIQVQNRKIGKRKLCHGFIKVLLIVIGQTWLQQNENESINIIATNTCKTIYSRIKLSKGG